MVTDQEIANCVESLLRQPEAAASAAVNVPAVVQQLEAKLGLDLSHKAGFIRDQIALLLRPPKDYFSLQQQHHQQQQQHHHQQQLQQHQQFQLHHQQQLQQHQQFLQSYPMALLPQQITTQSPFMHLPQHHELAFRCTPPPQVQMQQQQHAAAVAASAMTASMQKQEVGFTSGSSGTAAATKGSAQTGTKRRGGPGGLSKVCGVSPELQAIVGEPAMPRTQIVKQLWAYIRKNNLQDPNNKRKIICNEELRLVFETDCTDMFKMNKLLAKHIIPLEPTKDTGPGSKKKKGAEPEAVSATESLTESISTVTKTDTDNHSDAGERPMLMSESLVEFFGSEEREMLQSEALKRIWDYIKANHLEDPLNSTMLQLDSKLQQLFGCESLSALGIAEMLSHHFLKQTGQGSC